MAYNGQLSSNEIFNSIKNLIIGQQIFADIVKGTYGSLADLFKTEGSMYGDTKLFYSVQLGHVEDWANDGEAANLLALNRPADPYCQAVTIDQFKKIWLTTDQFMSRRAFGTEGVFSQFNSVILGTLRDTKRVYEAKLMNVAVGTIETAVGEQTKTVTLPTVTDEATARQEAQTIAKEIADIFVDLKDVTADYNDLGYERSYDESDFVVVWNSDYYNKITKLDLPTIFHNSNMIDKLGDYVLPAKYFGDVSTATTSAEGARSTKEQKIGSKWYRPGDVVETGSTVASGDTYTNNAKVICKIIHKDAIKYMSGFETMTEFMNPRSLTQNHYLIFGYSDPKKSRLAEFPFITVKSN